MKGKKIASLLTLGYRFDPRVVRSQLEISIKKQSKLYCTPFLQLDLHTTKT